MHTTNISFSLIVTVLLLSSPAQAGDEGAKKSPGSAVYVAAEAVKWAEVPGFPGVMIAAVHGDPGKGASHFMLKYPGGLVTPLHHHSADHYVTLVSGTLVMTTDGVDNKLGAGSFFALLKKKQHIAKCEGTAPCVMSIDARGKWDVVPAKDK